MKSSSNGVAYQHKSKLVSETRPLIWRQSYLSAVKIIFLQSVQVEILCFPKNVIIDSPEMVFLFDFPLMATGKLVTIVLNVN